MAGDEEVEAVTQAIYDTVRTYKDASCARMARAAIAALDRVRSRPAGSTTGGTEGEDHEAALGRALDAYDRFGDVESQSDHAAAMSAALLATSPVSGTEPDTAKLVEEAIAIIEGLAEQQAMPDDWYEKSLARLKYALAGVRYWCPDCGGTDIHHDHCDAFPGQPVVHGNRFSVDAGKPEENER